MNIICVSEEHRAQVRQLLCERWGSARIVSRGRLHQADQLPGFIAVEERALLGLATYHVDDDACELVSLDALRQRRCIGRALVERVCDMATQAGCWRLWLITTNDNLGALAFYQKLGFELVQLHRGALEASRRLKPEIPLLGEEGIPLRDELELELSLAAQEDLLDDVDYLQLINTTTSGPRNDVTPIFEDAAAFAHLVKDLAAPFRGQALELVAGIDALGFVLGAALARELKVGFLPVRKGGKLPVDVDRVTFVDYSGEEKQLELRKGSLRGGERVLLVDEWIETGAQIEAAIGLLEGRAADIVGVATINLDVNKRTRALLQRRRIHTLLTGGARRGSDTGLTRVRPLAPLLSRLQAIAASLAKRKDARALLALGSAGLEQDRLDEYSDLDFFVIVAPGAKAGYLKSLDWLSEAHSIAWSFANTADGRKLLFADGVFCEFAVFEEQELAHIPFAPGRVHWSVPDFDSALASPKNEPPLPRGMRDFDWLLGETLSNLYIGLCRNARGESLSALRFIQGYAVDRVLELAALTSSPSGQADARCAVDPFDATRRLETRNPDLAAWLPRFLPGYGRNCEAASSMLEWLQMRFELPAVMVVELQALMEESR